jgi:metal-responsive CopG/Arc/MetJ family transcriptional regulator
MKTAKVVKGFSVDPDTMQRVDRLVNFWGFKSRSELIETLLKEWLKIHEVAEIHHLVN